LFNYSQASYINSYILGLVVVAFKLMRKYYTNLSPTCLHHLRFSKHRPIRKVFSTYILGLISCCQLQCWGSAFDDSLHVRYITSSVMKHCNITVSHSVCRRDSVSRNSTTLLHVLEHWNINAIFISFL